MGAILILDDSASSLNGVRSDKKSACGVRQFDSPTNFNPIYPRQKIRRYYDKKIG